MAIYRSGKTPLEPALPLTAPADVEVARPLVEPKPLSQAELFTDNANQVEATQTRAAAFGLSEPWPAALPGSALGTPARLTFRRPFLFQDRASPFRCELVPHDGDDGFNAVLKLDVWNGAVVPLGIEKGNLAGRSRTVLGQEVSLEFDRQTRTVQVNLGGTHFALPLADARDTVYYADHLAGVLNRAIELTAQDASLQPAQREAMARLGGLVEGPNASISETVQSLRGTQNLTPAQVHEAPFWYALRTAAHEEPEAALPSLRANAAALAARYQGTPAGALLERGLADVSRESSPVENLHVVLAALHGARSIAGREGEPSELFVRGALEGMRESGQLLQERRGAKPELLPQLVRTTLRWVPDGLGSNHPLVQSLATELEHEAGERARSLPDQLTRAALAHGVVESYLTHGTLPAPHALDYRGVPTISRSLAFSPLELREADPGEPTLQTFALENLGQGKIGDCYYVAGEGALGEMRPQAQLAGLRRIVEPQRAPRFAIRQFVPDRNGDLRPEEVIVDGRLWADARTHAFMLAGDRQGSVDPHAPGLWLALKEKAFAQTRSGEDDFESVVAGASSESWKSTLGVDVGRDYVLKGKAPAEVLARMRQAIDRRWPVTTSTRSGHEGYGPTPLFACHEYLLRGVEGEPGAERVRLLNLHKPKPPPEYGHPLEEQARYAWASERLREHWSPRAIGEFSLSLAEYCQLFEWLSYAKLD